MKSAVPWSVKGVEHETREAAKAAARRAGMTLGAWLNHMIQQTGDEAATARSQFEVAGGTDAPSEQESDELSTVLNRLDALENHQNGAIEHLEHALEMLASRVPPQGHAPPTATNLEPRIAQLEAESKRRFDRLAKELGMIANRYSDLEERQEHGRQEIASLLEDLSRRPAPSTPAKGADPQFLNALEKRLQVMDGRLDAVGREARSAATTFQQALSTVMGRVVEGEKRQNAQGAALDARISNFESKIDGLSERIEEVLTRDGAGEAEAVHRLEQMVNAVTRQFEVVESRRERSHIAMEKTLRALAERLAETDRRHTQSVEEPLAALHQAVEDMSKRMAETSGAVEQRLADVTERIEQGDTEFRASRFSLMHAVDDVRQRLEVMEAGQTPLPPLVEEPEAPIKASLAQSAGARIEPGASAGGQNKHDLFSALAAQSRAFGTRSRELREEAEDRAIEAAEAEAPPLELEEEVAEAFEIEEISAEEPPFADVDEAEPETSQDEKADAHALDAAGDEIVERDPVGALLAAAREAARARARAGTGDDEGEDEAIDATFAVEDALQTLPRTESEEEKKLKRKLGRSPKIAVAVGIALLVIAAGVVALWLTTPKKSASGRPGLMESLLSDRSAFLYERATDEGTKSAEGPSASVMIAPAPETAAPASATPAPMAEAPAAPSAPAADEDAAFAPPPEPATTQELASLSTSAIADVRAAVTDAQKAEAAQKVTQAAMLGDPEAQFTLGRLYETGQGVKTDPVAARHWYEEAANQGHAAAAFNIGMMEARLGMPQSYVRASEWFGRAAKEGYADAQYNLAMLYARGLGVERDEAEAYAWFAAAASRGDTAAAAERDRLAQGFDPATRERAESLAKDRIQG